MGDNFAQKEKALVEAAKTLGNNLTKARDKTVASCERVTAEQNEAESRYHHVLSSVRQVEMAHEDGKNEASSTVAKLRKLYYEGLHVPALTSMSQVSALSRRVMERESTLQERGQLRKRNGGGAKSVVVTDKVR